MSKKMSRYPSDRKVYVGDLGNSARKNDLEYAFGAYGTLRSVWIARNPPGFAFVEFEDARDAADAVRGLDGRTVCGRRARVELSTGKFAGSGRGGDRRMRDRPRRMNSDDNKCYECGGRGHYARECRRRGHSRRRTTTCYKMFVLYETPAGYAIFKLLDEKKLAEVDNLYLEFQTPEKANKLLKLKHFQKFNDTTEALAAATAAVEGKLAKPLKKTLKKVFNEEVQSSLLVADAKLGNAIKDKLSVQCVYNTGVQELMRCIRQQADSLLGGLPKREMTAMALGLAHSLSRYKLKFSPDKIDTMIVQAQCLLDDLDKELNNYMMRAREWYGWHFPELGKLIVDNVAFVKTIKLVGTRENMAQADLSDILPEEVEEKVKEAAEISMGTEISEEDIMNIQSLCDEILSINEYRTHLYDYLKTRMMAMAPNLTILVGETVGARLIAHAGSLINLAKHPSSTVQILGAEKALFRALKTKKDTPKYGLIFHAQLVGQASAKNKGKMSRSLAAKASLATRVDAFGEEATYELGATHKVKLEARLRLLEEGNLHRLSGTGKAKAKFEKYQAKRSNSRSRSRSVSRTHRSRSRSAASVSRSRSRSRSVSATKTSRKSRDVTYSSKSRENGRSAGENGDSYRYSEDERNGGASPSPKRRYDNSSSPSPRRTISSKRTRRGDSTPSRSSSRRD